MITEDENEKNGDEEFIDTFEKLFGKPPESGYEFKYLVYSLGWRSVVISWGCVGVGFGELAFIFTDKGLEIDDEMMGSEFVITAIEEACHRIEGGQKAEKFVKWDNEKGPVYEESTENHESLIKNILLTFKYYVKENPCILNSSNSNEE